MVKVSPMSLVQLTKWAERVVPRPRGSTWARYRLVRVVYPIGPAEDTVGSSGGLCTCWGGACSVPGGTKLGGLRKT